MTENNRIEMFKQALEEDPENELARFSLANELYEEGEYEEALEHYQKALEAKEDWMAVYLQMGRCRLELGEKEAARAALDRAKNLVLASNDDERLEEINELLEEVGGG